MQKGFRQPVTSIETKMSDLEVLFSREAKNFQKKGVKKQKFEFSERRKFLIQKNSGAIVKTL